MAAQNTAAPARRRLLISIIFGLAAGLILAWQDKGELAPLGGWDLAALIFIVWAWATVGPMDPGTTKSHARQEDAGRTFTDIVLIAASLASLIAVGFLIVEASNNSGFTKGLDIFLGLVSVVVSWTTVQTTYALRYARLYYGDPEGGIDFNNDESPSYKDFAYLAFTLGMTFQVSDTTLKNRDIRGTALRQSLLSYVFGTVIIATTINTIASLTQ